MFARRIFAQVLFAPFARLVYLYLSFFFISFVEPLAKLSKFYGFLDIGYKEGSKKYE